MTLEQMRIFVAVAEREHVTGAARALNLTQSAVSNALAALEDRHGLQLFDRVGRGVVLNENGRAFLPEARSVLARAQAAEAVLTDLSALRRGRLPIFASQTIASYWLPKRLVGFHARHPGVELVLSVGNTREAGDAVRDGAAELGFVEGEVDDPMLHQEIIGEDQLILLAPLAHPWTRQTTLQLSDLSAAAWVTRERGSGTRSTLESVLSAAGIDPDALNVSMTLPTNEAVLSAVAAGAGVAALSASVAEAALTTGRLTSVPFPLPSRSFRLLTHIERYCSRAAEAFIAELKL